MSGMTSFALRVRKTRQERGFTQAELAHKIGVRQSTIGNIESGRNQGSTMVAQLAAALGVNALWLAEGKGPKEAPSYISGKRQHTGTASSYEMAAFVPREGYLRFFPLTDAFSAGGETVLPDSPEAVDSIDLAEIEAQRLLGTTDCEHIRLLTVRGDSMAPTMKPRDLLFVDTRVSDFNGDGVYLLELNGFRVIKRVQMVGDQRILLTSDNPVYHPFELGESDTLHYIGRVIRVLPLTLHPFT
jgi:phage repressor protein C with HTH and peptisase S24 domain